MKPSQTYFVTLSSFTVNANLVLVFTNSLTSPINTYLIILPNYIPDYLYFSFFNNFLPYSYSVNILTELCVKLFNQASKCSNELKFLNDNLKKSKNSIPIGPHFSSTLAGK